jgi:hypothetical protein
LVSAHVDSFYNATNQTEVTVHGITFKITQHLNKTTFKLGEDIPIYTEMTANNTVPLGILNARYDMYFKNINGIILMND